jgi:hypothetical protein
MSKSLVSVRIDDKVLRQAKAYLKTRTRSETVRRALEVVAEQARFRRWVMRYSATTPEDFMNES